MRVGPRCYGNPMTSLVDLEADRLPITRMLYRLDGVLQVSTTHANQNILFMAAEFDVS